MSKTKMMDKKEKKRCFVITPIGKEMSPIRRHIEGVIDAAIEPALGDDYEIVVSHRICEQGLITKQIIKEIYNDELFVANLTERNPNVMYELALCHALGKPVIMIAEKDTNLPADVIMQRTIFYYNDAQGVLELRNDLIKAEKEIQFGKKAGPLIDVLGDISHDIALVQQVKEENISEGGQMEYIINRLNKIEDSLKSNYRRDDVSHSKYSRIRRLEYEADKINPEVIAPILKSSLNRALDMNNFDASVIDLRIDKENKLISLYLRCSESYDFETISKFIVIILKENGVYGCRSKDFMITHKTKEE